MLRHTQEPPTEFTSLTLTWKQFLVMAYPWQRLAFVIEILMMNGTELTHFTSASQPSVRNFGTYSLKMDSVRFKLFISRGELQELFKPPPCTEFS